MGKFEVIIYSKADNSEPVMSFLETLPHKIYAKVARSINLLQTYGNELREPDSKELEDGIFELRVIQGTDTVRILYFFIIGRKIILTNGFIKKTQKTPKKEIEKAKIYRKDYLARCERRG